MYHVDRILLDTNMKKEDVEKINIFINNEMYLMGLPFQVIGR
jgi:hypothetical protein